MTARTLALAGPAPDHPPLRRVAAVELAPGVWLYRAGACGCDGHCERCAGCEPGWTGPARPCPHGPEWGLTATCGLAVPGAWRHRDVAALRRYAADVAAVLAELGVDLADTDPARVQAAVRAARGTPAGCDALRKLTDRLLHGRDPGATS